MSPRRYQGRPLPRPDEELVDQGFAFDLETLMGRRQLLRAFGIGAATLGLAACGTNDEAGGSSGPSASASVNPSSGEIPEEMDGPFPGDGSNGPDVLEQSGVVRSDIRSSFGGPTGKASGIPMTIELTVLDLAKGGVPFTGAAVYVWQCDAAGLYSMYSEGATKENYLRGVQIADSSGTVKFTSVFPACYGGDFPRWPHVHFEVYPDQGSITDVTKAIATSQLALPKNVCDDVYRTKGYEESPGTLAKITLQKDLVFGEDSAATQMATVTGTVTSGYAARMTFGVDTRTKPAGGDVPPVPGTIPEKFLRPPSGSAFPSGMAPPPGGALPPSGMPPR